MDDNTSRLIQSRETLLINHLSSIKEMNLYAVQGLLSSPLPYELVTEDSTFLSNKCEDSKAITPVLALDASTRKPKDQVKLHFNPANCYAKITSAEQTHEILSHLIGQVHRLNRTEKYGSDLQYKILNEKSDTII
jgi:hypothetical protein